MTRPFRTIALRACHAACLAVLALFLGGCPNIAAQGPTYTIPQTVTQTFTGTCTGSQQTFAITNLGQTQHYVYTSQTFGTTSFQMAIYGIDTAGNLYQISDSGRPDPANVNISMAGTGYYPKEEIVVTCLPVASTFTLNYTGTSSTTNNLVGSYLVSQIQKTEFANASAAANQSDQFITPFGSSAGSIYFQYQTAGQAGGSLTVQCTGGFGSSETLAFTLANTASVQNFSTPSFVCPVLQVTYNTGGAGAATGINLEYRFFSPGTADLTRSNYLHVTGTTATAVAGSIPGVLRSVTVNTPAAGTISIFDLASAACTATPSTNVVAVITGTSTAPVGTLTYNVAFLNGICVKASATMDFTIGYQ